MELEKMCRVPGLFKTHANECFGFEPGPSDLQSDALHSYEKNQNIKNAKSIIYIKLSFQSSQADFV